MSIDREIVGFFGAVAAATVAGRANMPIPQVVAADPATIFHALVKSRGETEMRRHAERLAVHMVSECRAGRTSLNGLEERVATLTSIVCSFPPKANLLAEELDRSRGRSPAASALLVASAVVSRAQARGQPEQARIDPSWATDLIAEALVAFITEPALLAAAERAVQSVHENDSRPVAASTIAPALQTVPIPADAGNPVHGAAAAELRDACHKRGMPPSDIEPAVAAKLAKFGGLQATLLALPKLSEDSRHAQSLRLEAKAALTEGKLARSASLLAELADCLVTEGRKAAAVEIFLLQGQLDETRFDPKSAAVAYGKASHYSAGAPVSVRWGHALRQAAALASHADELGRAGASPAGPLSEAAQIYTMTLQTLPREEAPELHTVAQNCLGNTLLRLGEIEGKLQLLEHAATAYRSAAAGMNRTTSPRDWALVHSNLGTALLKSGELTNAERYFADSASAFETALEELKPEVSAADWVSAEAGRAIALGRLGALRGDIGLLERAARMVEAALARFDRKQAPGEWARLQSSLGNICANLGERIGGRHWLERANAAYHSAQLEWTEQGAPLQWALSEANRGSAQLRLGALTGSRRHLQLAEQSLADAERAFVRLGEQSYAAAARQSLQAVHGALDVAAPGDDLRSGSGLFAS